MGGSGWLELVDSKDRACSPRLAVGAERKNATPAVAEGCASSKLAPALGLESKRPFFSSVQNFHKKPPNRCTSMRWASPLMTANLRSVHTVDRSTAHLSRIRGSHMGHTDAELAQVILTWAKLTTEKKGQILAMLMDGDQQARTGT